MKKHFVEILCCPDCKCGLEIIRDAGQRSEEIENGTLKCPCCEKEYPVLERIPVFCGNSGQ